MDPNAQYTPWGQIIGGALGAAGRAYLQAPTPQTAPAPTNIYAASQAAQQGTGASATQKAADVLSQAAQGGVAGGSVGGPVGAAVGAALPVAGALVGSLLDKKPEQQRPMYMPTPHAGYQPTGQAPMGWQPV